MKLGTGNLRFWAAAGLMLSAGWVQASTNEFFIRAGSVPEVLAAGAVFGAVYLAAGIAAVLLVFTLFVASHRLASFVRRLFSYPIRRAPISGVRLAVFLCVLLAATGSVPAAEPIEMSVTTNSVMVLPPRNLGRSYGTVWSSETTVSQGDVLRWGNNHYMVQDVGTTGTNAPTFVVGTETNGTSVLRYIEKGPRLGFILMLNSDDSIRINLNGPAVPGIGPRIRGEMSLWQQSGNGVPQSGVWVVSDSGTNAVAALEW